MRQERLLERIYRMEIDPDRREDNNPVVYIHSVMNHLQRILNTRQGGVPIAGDYGMPEFTNLPGAFSTGATHEVETLLKNAIEKYEPRLQSIQVFFEPQESDLLALRFKIEAKLSLEHGGTVEFETIVDAGGKITVKE